MQVLKTSVRNVHANRKWLMRQRLELVQKIYEEWTGAQFVFEDNKEHRHMKKEILVTGILKTDFQVRFTYP